MSHISFNNLSEVMQSAYKPYHSTETALLKVLTDILHFIDQKKVCLISLLDLSAAFDTIDHDILITRLNRTFGISGIALSWLTSYLKDRHQRVKVGNSFSEEAVLKFGVPQGSVLGPILFNIYLNDLFYINESTNVCYFADDTTFHACDLDLSTLLIRLEHDSSLAIEWFDSNYMKLNEDKCHLLVSGHKFESTWVKVGDSTIWESKEQKLLGVQIDKQLKFDNHVYSLCKNAGKKLSALARLSAYLNQDQRKTLMTTFIESQFNYSPLTWMFHGRKSNNRINHIHERALRLVYNDDKSSFTELLNRNNSYCVHHKNIQFLAIELYKIKNNISTQIMSELFPLRDNSFLLRNQTDFATSTVNTSSYGISSLRFFGTKIWSEVPNNIKNSKSLNEFKSRIKKWTPICQCKLCKIYVKDVGYI